MTDKIAEATQGTVTTNAWEQVSDGKIPTDMGMRTLDLTTLPTPMTVLDVNEEEAGVFHGTSTATIFTVYTTERGGFLVPNTHILAYNLATRQVRLNVSRAEVLEMEPFRAGL